MLWSLLFLIGGLIALLLAGDFLVRGAVSGALKLGVSQILASVIIVGFGTSAPEMLVALEATLEGRPGLAMGNIVGSNIANILLVLGAPALLITLHTKARGLLRVTLVTAVATIVWLAITPTLGLTRAIGLSLLGALIVYVIGSFIFSSPAEQEDDIADEAKDPPMSWVKTAGFVSIGIVGLPLGAHFAITGANQLADQFELNSELVGLTLLAIGTSLPELSAALAAALRREADVVLGNVAGSNLFNILGAGGIISLFGPISLPGIFEVYDHWVMGGVFAIFTLFVLTRRSIGKLTGAVFLATYAAYVVGLYHFYVVGGTWSTIWP